eukprot:TRINITY_DN9983_c0_g1_i1.p1 TRINITY_DN9983_c0_g1~~TRINITY_DN9983_c0_g1_i1.p1  ORF type:complete len:135 (+),score=22.86 TRINITY_DN9983_c0_g1_i1:49-405(+)
MRNAKLLERPIPKGKSEVSLSAFAFMFSEMVQYTKTTPSPADSLSVWESRLHKIGYRVGTRVLELTVYRSKDKDTRETDLIRFLTFIQQNVWKTLFGKQADGLVKVAADKDQVCVSAS